MTTATQTRATAPTTSPSTAPQRVRAVLYVHISDDREGLEKGVERQEADCRAYAEPLGYEVAEVFRENDTSAQAAHQSPAPPARKSAPGSVLCCRSWLVVGRRR